MEPTSKITNEQKDQASVLKGVLFFFSAFSKKCCKFASFCKQDQTWLVWISFDQTGLNWIKVDQIVIKKHFEKLLTKHVLEKHGPKKYGLIKFLKKHDLKKF